MANDELTVARLQQRAARFLGWRRPSDWPVEHSPVELANEVGEWFVSTHEWNFLTRPPVYLAVSNGQGYSELPADFTRHLALFSASASARSIRLEDPTAVGLARADGNTVAGSFVGCITFGEPTTAGPRATARLELGPIPTYSEAQAFVLVYKGGWTTVDSVSDHIALPAFVTALYVRAYCEWIAGLEQASGGSIYDRLDRLVASSLWQAAVERDDTMQMDLGQVYGGIGEMMGSPDDEYPYPRSNGPVPIL